MTGRAARWIGARQQALSDRVHAGGDAAAAVHGWTVTKGTGRFGFGARAYRDPRFAARQAAAASKAGAPRRRP